MAPWLAVVREETMKMAAGRAQSGPSGQRPGKNVFSGPWVLGVTVRLAL